MHPLQGHRFCHGQEENLRNSKLNAKRLAAQNTIHLSRRKLISQIAFKNLILKKVNSNTTKKRITLFVFSYKTQLSTARIVSKKFQIDLIQTNLSIKRIYSKKIYLK